MRRAGWRRCALLVDPRDLLANPRIAVVAGNPLDLLQQQRIAAGSHQRDRRQTHLGVAVAAELDQPGGGVDAAQLGQARANSLRTAGSAL